MSKEPTPVTRGGAAAMFGSGVMAVMTAAVVVLHIAMFGIASTAPDGGQAIYLWLGTIEAAATASAAAVLYRLQWNPITPARGFVLALGALSGLETIVLWMSV